MSKLEVDAIEPQSGTTLTIGASGDTINLAAGATQSGFGLSGWSEDGANNNLLPASASAGIYLGTTSATASNLLDDYEEGTWTPTVDVGTVSTSGSTYTKIGRQVFLHFVLTNFSDTTTASDIEVRGLPFTQSSAVGNVGGVAFGERTDVNKPIIILTNNFMRFVDGFGSSDYDDALEYANINNGGDCDIVGTINYQTDA